MLLHPPLYFWVSALARIKNSNCLPSGVSTWAPRGGSCVSRGPPTSLHPMVPAASHRTCTWHRAARAQPPAPPAKSTAFQLLNPAADRGPGCSSGLGSGGGDRAGAFLFLINGMVCSPAENESQANKCYTKNKETASREVS